MILLCVGGVGEVTPPLTLLSHLRYVGILLGGDGNCPQKIVVCKYQKLASKKHGSILYQRFGDKTNPSHCRNWNCVPKTPIRFHVYVENGVFPFSLEEARTKISEILLW
jgi:hypothetical protein